VRRVGGGAGSQARPGVLGHELRAGQGIIHRNPPHRAVEFDSQRAGRIPNRSKPADIFRVEPAWSQWRGLVYGISNRLGYQPILTQGRKDRKCRKEARWRKRRGSASSVIYSTIPHPCLPRGNPVRLPQICR
jgi:hypothetical protein